MALLIVFFIVIVFTLNYISTKYIFKGISYSRNISKHIVEVREQFNIEIEVENDRYLPATFLQVVERFPDTFEYMTTVNAEKIKGYLIHTSTLFIMPHKRVTRIYNVCCNHRGYYDFNNHDVTINEGDLVGANIYNKTLPYKNELIVLPEKSDINSELIPYGSYVGNMSVKRWILEDPVMIIGVREYTGVEPQKNIHWNSSLKCGNLMVKEFDHTTDSKVIIMFNMECLMPFPLALPDKEKNKIERCISIVRGFIEELAEKGMSYGFATNAVIKGGENENFVPPAFGQNYMYHMFENLGRIVYELKQKFVDFLEDTSDKLDKSISLVIVTPTIDARYISEINAISSKCSRTLVVSLDSRNISSLNHNIITFIDGGTRVG